MTPSSQNQFLHEVTPSRPTEPLRATKVDRQGRPSGPEKRFSICWIDFGTNFCSFSRLHRASDSTRGTKGRTFVFAGRCSTFKDSQALHKISKHARIEEKSRPCSFAHETGEDNMIFSLRGATWRRFWLPRRSPECFWALFLAPRDVFADTRDPPGARRGRPKTLLKRSWNALGCHGVSSEGSGVDFDMIFGALEAPEIDLGLISPKIPMIPRRKMRHEKTYGNLVEFSRRLPGNCR